jgi:hypothetical protein
VSISFAPTLTLTGLGIAGIAAVVHVLLYRRLNERLHISRGRLAAGLAVLALTLALAFLLLPKHGTSDDHIFLTWMQEVSAKGVSATYEADHSGALDPALDQRRDYPPLTYAILFGAARSADALNLPPLLGLKLSLALFVLLSYLVLWHWTGNPIALGMLAMTLLVDGMVYGYLDAYFTPTLLLALWALQAKKYPIGVALFGLSCLIKWQPLIVAPFALAYVVWNDAPRNLLQTIRWRRLGTAVLAPLALEVVLLVLFFGPTPLLSFEAATVNLQLSGQALNLNWIFTHLLHVLDPRQFGGLKDHYATVIKTLDWHLLLVPKLLFGLFYGACGLIWLRRPKSFERMIVFMLLGFLSYFILNTGVHENHLYVAAVLGIVAWHLDPVQNVLAPAWAVLNWVNIRLFYDLDGNRLLAERVIGGIDLALPLAIGFTLFFVYYYVKTLHADQATANQPARPNAPVTSPV